MVVLLSAGLDSTYNLYKAMQVGHVVLALTFNYRQRAVIQEVEYAKKLCGKLKIPHQVVDLTFFSEFSSSSLLNTEKQIPTGHAVNVSDKKTSEQTAKSVWVPNRNGIFLNIGAGYAEALGAQYVVPGFNKEEAQTFPDNSQEYVEQLDCSFALSTANAVKVRCFSIGMDKTEIVKEGIKLGIDWKSIWPCYFSGAEICRECESCQRYLRALEANGVDFNAL